MYVFSMYVCKLCNSLDSTSINFSKITKYFRSCKCSKWCLLFLSLDVLPLSQGLKVHSSFISSNCCNVFYFCHTLFCEQLFIPAGSVKISHQYLNMSPIVQRRKWIQIEIYKSEKSILCCELLLYCASYICINKL